MSDSRQPSFAEALEIAGQWIGLWEAGELSDEVLADRVAELVASRDGARGFFVVALAGEGPLMDRLPEPLLLALRQAGEPVVDLMVRNLAMSSAMVVAHGRSGNVEQQQGSERVQRRALELLRQLEPLAVKERLESLLAATTATPAPRDANAAAVAADQTFLDRWSYDPDQRAAIGAAILAVAENGQ
ncbi:MAG: hypothetical protein VKN13_07055 [Cyanobacteriota bacterium]|nr:hypothetical protein [Cyanobacteriota bacterium]